MTWLYILRYEVFQHLTKLKKAERSIYVSDALSIIIAAFALYGSRQTSGLQQMETAQSTLDKADDNCDRFKNDNCTGPLLMGSWILEIPSQRTAKAAYWRIQMNPWEYMGEVLGSPDSHEQMPGTWCWEGYADMR